MNIFDLKSICFFLSCYFPGIALLALLSVTIVLAVLEKRKRKLKLLASTEEKQIDALLAQNTINQEEAKQLKKAINALPEIVEEYPLPDIHLRLTAALAKTYSFLKILLLSSVMFIFYVIYKTGQQAVENATATSKITMNNPWMFVIVTSLLITFAVIQFIASIRLTRGSKLSQWTIMIIWLIDLAFLPIALINANNLIHFFVAISAGAYSIWTLYLRKSAGKFIRINASPVSQAKKSVMVAIFIGCIAFGVFRVNSHYFYSSTETASQSQLMSSRRNDVSSISRIAVVATAPDKASSLLAGEIYQSLKKQLPEIEFTYLKYGNSFTSGMTKFDLFIFVRKTKTVSSKKLNLPAPALKCINREFGMINHLSGKMNIKSGQTISFVINMASKFNCYNFNYNYKSYLNFDNASTIAGSILLTSDISGCTEKAAIDACKEKAVGHIYDELIKQRDYSRIKYPAFLNPPLSKVKLDNPACLKKAWKIGNFRSVQYSNFSVYLLPLEEDREKQQKKIIKDLQNSGWIYHPKGDNKDVICFSKSKDKDSSPQIRVTLPRKPYSGNSNEIGAPKSLPEFGYFVYALSNEKTYSKNEALKFKQYDFTSFIHCVYMHRLSEPEVVEIYNQASNTMNLDYHTLKAIYSQTKPGKNFLTSLKTRRDSMLIEMGKKLKQNSNTENFGTNLISFVNLLVKENKDLLKQPAFAPFKDAVKIVNLSKSKTNDGLYTVENINIPGKDTPALLWVRNIGDSGHEVLCALSRRKSKNNEKTVTVTLGTMDNPALKYFGGMTSSSTRKGLADIQGAFQTLKVEKGQAGSCSSSGNLMFKQKFSVGPKYLGFCYDYLVKPDNFNFEIIYNPK